MNSKRFLIAALGVAVVAMMIVPVAFGSNMGFKLERQLENVPNTPSLYFISLPYFRSVEDLADDAGINPAGDGTINVNDLLVDWYTGGDGVCDNPPAFPDECLGQIRIQIFDNDTTSNPNQTFTEQGITNDPFAGIIFIGATFSIEANAGDLNQGAGYQVFVDTGAYPTITVGSHNPDFGNGQWLLQDFGINSLDLNHFSLPYHATFANSEELLLAMFDPANDENISLFTFVNSTTDNPLNDGTFSQILFDQISQQVIVIHAGPAATQDCSPNGFCLQPGNGYLIKIETAGVDGTVAVPLPHY